MTDKDPSKFNRALIEVTVAAPADQVWRALRDPATILQWFGWDADTLPDEVEHIFVTYAKPSDADRVLRFDGAPDWFEVEARGETSIVRVVRPAPTADTDWDDIFEDMIQGWIAFVQQLKFALERHPGASRRTLYFSGSPHPAGALSAAALGLPAAAPVGATYALSTPVGDLAGTVWHRGRHQIGVTVPAWGDGLLVALDRPPSDRYPTGASSVTLTTYGLDDTAFEALRTRWSAWWDASFAKAEQSTCE